MDLTVDLHADRLACGADLADLVEQVADGRGHEYTGHQRGCPYCRAALTELLLRWAPLRAVVDDPVTVPPGLYRAVLRRLRRLSGGDGYARWLSDAGSTRVGRWVLEEIAVRAAARAPGVAAARRAEVTPVETPGGGGRLPELTVRVGVAVTGDRPVPEVAAGVRAAVGRDLAHYAGLPVAEVDVDVLDVAGG